MYELFRLRFVVYLFEDECIKLIPSQRRCGKNMYATVVDVLFKLFIHHCHVRNFLSCVSCRCFVIDQMLPGAFLLKDNISKHFPRYTNSYMTTDKNVSQVYFVHDTCVMRKRRKFYVGN